MASSESTPGRRLALGRHRRVAELGSRRTIPPSRHAEGSAAAAAVLAGEGLPPSREALAAPADPLETGIGTHYAWLWVGSPPQRQSVIIDTGSYHTAFPCDPCGDCGDYTSYHEGPPFEPKESSTCAATGGAWTASYSEGDGWHADVVNDVAFVGGRAIDDVPGAASLAIEMDLGCMDQLANGIMGMAMHAETLVPKLSAAGLVDRNAFSLCFASEGGTMTLGSASPHLHKTPMRYAKMQSRSSIFYGVTLVDVQVVPAGAAVKSPGGEGSIGSTISYGGVGSTIVDSGTTYTYLPASLRAPFEAKWLAVAGFPYSTSNPLTPSQAAGPLPDLAFVLEGDGVSEGRVVVRVGPSAYLDHWCHDDGKGGAACEDYQTISWEGSTLLLGANVLESHDVLFDTEGSRLGVAPATDCSFANGPTPAPTLTPAPSVSAAPTGLPTRAPVAAHRLGLDAVALAVAVALLACVALQLAQRAAEALARFRAHRAAAAARSLAARTSGVVPPGEASSEAYGPCLGRLCACAVVCLDRPCCQRGRGGGSASGGEHLRGRTSGGRFAALENEDEADARSSSMDVGAMEMESARELELSPVNVTVVPPGAPVSPTRPTDDADEVITFEAGARRPVARAAVSVSLPTFNPMAMLGRTPGGYVRPGEGSEF